MARKAEDEREIQERLNMWDDLMEKDPKIRKIYEENVARGRAKGYNEGMRMGIIAIVSTSFPNLTEQAQQIVAKISKPEKLDLLLTLILKAPDEDVVRLLLDLAAA